MEVFQFLKQEIDGNFQIMLCYYGHLPQICDDKEKFGSLRYKISLFLFIFL